MYTFKDYEIEFADVSFEEKLTKAKELINNFCLDEFQSEADFSDLSSVAIGYTTVTDEEIPLQIYVNLSTFVYEKYLEDILVEATQYNSIDELIFYELNSLDFDEMAYVNDKELEYYYSEKSMK